MAQNRRPTVLKTTPPPHARRFCGAAHQSCAARDGAPMGRAAEWWRSSAHLRPIWLARWLPVVPRSPPRRPNTRAIAYDRAARHTAHPPTLAKEGRGENTGRAKVFSSRHACLKEHRGLHIDFGCLTLLQRKQRPSRTHAERRLLRSGERETRREAGGHTYRSTAGGLSPPRAARHRCMAGARVRSGPGDYCSSYVLDDRKSPCPSCMFKTYILI